MRGTLIRQLMEINLGNYGGRSPHAPFKKFLKGLKRRKKRDIIIKERGRRPKNNHKTEGEKMNKKAAKEYREKHKCWPSRYWAKKMNEAGLYQAYERGQAATAEELGCKFITISITKTKTYKSANGMGYYGETEYKIKNEKNKVVAVGYY